MDLSTQTQTILVDGVAPQFNSGFISIYTGSSPGADVAATGTLLGTATFSATAFGAAVNGIATANAITQDSSTDAAGTVGYARCFKSDGTSVIGDATVGVTSSGAEMEFDSLTVAALGTFQVTSFKIQS